MVKVKSEVKMIYCNMEVATFVFSENIFSHPVASEELKFKESNKSAETS